MTEKAKEINPAQARRILEAEVKNRERECLNEIRKTLDKYKCQIVPVIEIRGEQVRSRVEVVAQ